MALFGSCAIRISLAGMLGILSHPGVSAAQTAAWITPAGGYVYDRIGRSIRPIRGFVGSASLGPAVMDGVEWASIAPNQKSAIVRRSDSLVWIPDLGVPDQTQGLDRIPPVRGAFWASDSSRAVILTAGEQLIWLSNFGSRPDAEASWDLNVFTPPGSTPSAGGEGTESDGWRLLAADSQGDNVLLAFGAGGIRQVWTASGTAAPVPISFPSLPAGLSPVAVFASGSSTAFIADAASHRILQIQSPGNSPVITQILYSEGLVNDPAGIALSVDDSRIFIPDRATSTVRIFDSGSGALITELPLDATPRSLTTVAPGRFLVNPAGKAEGPFDFPFDFLDTGDPARISFVPRGE